MCQQNPNTRNITPNVDNVVVNLSNTSLNPTELELLSQGPKLSPHVYNNNIIQRKKYHAKEVLSLQL